MATKVGGPEYSSHVRPSDPDQSGHLYIRMNWPAAFRQIASHLHTVPQLPQQVERRAGGAGHRLCHGHRDQTQDAHETEP